MKLIIAVLLLVGSELSEGSTNCRVRVKSLGIRVQDYKQPLFLQPGSSNIWPVSNDGHMEFSGGQTLELFCNSRYSKPVAGPGSQLATCNSGTHFQINGASYDLTQVACVEWPEFTARKTGAMCEGGVVVESGFDLGRRFIRQLEICFNEELQTTRYVKHNLDPSTSFHQNGIQRPLVFGQYNLFGQKNVDELYKRRTTMRTIPEQLNRRDIDVSIDRGHLAALADFVYGNPQRATCIFVNAAPQWTGINTGNWKTMEDNTRAWVTRTGKKLNCYTGAFGITYLPNAAGVQTHLYLDYHRNGRSFIPIPMLYFRVLIEPATNKGVVLVTVNNPHQHLRDFVVCTKDVSDELTWLKWEKLSVKLGYSYACEVEEFLRRNPHLPRLSVSGLLK